MRKFILILSASFLFLMFFPSLAFSQNENESFVKLKSGDFLPSKNIAALTKDSIIFEQSKFNDKHYLTLQFYTLPSKGTEAELKAAGISLLDYIPYNSFTAAVNKQFDLQAVKKISSLRSIFILANNQKASKEIIEKTYPAWSVNQTGYIDVNMISYEKLDGSILMPAFAEIGAVMIDEFPAFRSFVVRVPQANMDAFLSLSFIQWVEPIDPPNVTENLLGRSLHRVNVLNDGPRNLKGSGVNMGVWDGGSVSPHIDFAPLATRLRNMEPGFPSDHSTHVAGIMAGAGIIDYRARGMAPKAKIFSYDFNGNVANEMAAAIPLYNLSVSNHSYGGSVATCALTGSQVAYSSTSRNNDINLNNYPYHMHVQSAGNSQTSCPSGWFTITGSSKMAKNNIVVANITSTEAISGSSSFGPVADGRVKPEISSFGSSVLSTYLPYNSYGTISGTSMASPGVSGTMALLVERYRQLNGNAEPLSSLLKAVVCNTAFDLGNPGPDYRFGFGRINGLLAVRALEQNRYVINTITTGSVNDLSITVPAGAVRLKAMLTWNDPAGASNSNPALVNNLDFSIVKDEIPTLPWKLDPNNPASSATRGIDNVSNIEQVTIDNPAAGNYILRVEGTSIPVGGPQQYSLTWMIDQPFIELTYPNGGEAMDPGSTEVITWDNAGITTNQTIEYSLDNGTTWTVISSTIAAAANRFTWTVPALHTSTARIRISSGTISDMSDANFPLLGIPKSFKAVDSTCVANSLSFVWAPVSNATHYDIYRLNETTGDFGLVASNITTNTATINGLIPNEAGWFTIRAKNNTVGSVSERAIGIYAVVPGSGIANTGSITGNNNLCGNTAGVTYSIAPVSGANNYRWSVPAGATITSGQGTTSIVVSYGQLAQAGNISVVAGNGTCQTPAQMLPVVVKPSPGISLSPIDTAICTPGTVTLTVTEPAFRGGISSTPCGTNNVNATIGTSAGQNTASTYPSVYANNLESAKIQLLLRPAELTSMGVAAGTKMSSIGFDVFATNNVGVLRGFTIKMAHTTNNALLGMAIYNAVPVLNPVDYTPVAGINLHTLDNPFIWDGTSSLIIEICHSNDSGPTNQATTNASVQFTNPGFNGYSIYTSSNEGNVCNVSGSNFVAPSGISASRPIVIINGCTTTSSPSSFTWSSASGLSATSGSSVVASPASTTVYTVTATNAEGCTATASTTVNVPNAANATGNNSPLCIGNNLQLYTSPALPNRFSSIKLTEITQFRNGSGQTSPYPPYVPPVLSGNADDYVEISNVDNANSVNMEGAAFEFWGPATAGGTLAFNRSFIFPASAVIPPNGVLVLHLGVGPDDPANRYYNTGGTTNPITSGQAGGYLIRAASAIVDVVTTNSGVWPAGSGVTSAHWSGNIATTTNLAGVIRTAAVDNNTSANWAVSGTLIQSIGTYNGGYTNISPYSWSGPNGFTSTAQNPLLSNITAAAAGSYTVNIAGGNGCTSTQSTTVTLNTASAPDLTAGFQKPLCLNETLQLFATTTSPGASFSWTGPAGFTSTAQNPQIPNITASKAGTYIATVNAGGCSTSASVVVTLKQMGGIYTIGLEGDYSTLTDAVNDYNIASCVTGPIVFELTSKYSGGENFPITILANSNASAINTLTIRPGGNSIASLSGVVPGNGMIRLDGARYVIIDGRMRGLGAERSMTIQNASNSTLAGTSAIILANGAQFNTIRNLEIYSANANTAALSGGIVFGSSNTGLGNNDNSISQNIFTGVGTTQSRQGLINDGTFTTPNSRNKIDSNSFRNIIVNAIALNAGTGNNWQITNNHIYFDQGSFGLMRMISINNATSVGHTISGNFIGGGGFGAAGLLSLVSGTSNNWWGMELNVGTTTPTIVSKNVIRNVNITTPTPANDYNVVGIGCMSGAFTITDNTINNLTSTVSGPSGTMIAGILYQNTNITSGSEISGNTIFDLVNANNSSTNTAVNGIAAVLTTNEVLPLRKNRVYGLSIPNTTAATSVTSGILVEGTGTSGTARLENNMISIGYSAPNNVAIYGVNNTMALANLQLYYNTIAIGGVTTGANASAALLRNNTSGNSQIEMRSNIYYNERTGGSGGHYSLINNNPTPGSGWGSSASNYNNFYTANPAENVLWGFSPLSFNNFKTASGGDVNSASVVVNYLDKALADLHLNGSSVGDQNLKGTTVSGINTDYDNDLRSSTVPYMGADEAPVSLPNFIINFSGVVKGRDAELRWNTSTEINVDKMELQRSIGSSGVVWNMVTELKAKSNSAGNAYQAIDKGLADGRHLYRLKVFDKTGSFKYTPIVVLDVMPGGAFVLNQNYPNPVKSGTRISYQLAKEGLVIIEIMSVDGRRLSTLINKHQQVGMYNLELNSKDLNVASGMLFYKLSVKDSNNQLLFTSTKQMIVIE